MRAFSSFRPPALSITLAFAIIFGGSPIGAQEDSQTVGLESSKPESGKSVPIKGGFMVEYQATIPGTNVKYTMVPIPGGRFTIGSPVTEKERNEDEGPQFDVIVEPFWMSKYELTWAEYRSYMDLNRKLKVLRGKGLRIAKPKSDLDAVTAPSALYDPSYTFSPGEGQDQPAATMTQFSAMQYSKWLSLISTRFYRLPTEAEWEYACRAGSKTAYHFGDDPAELKKYAWFDDDGLERHPVGKLLPNQFGLYDMHGNVSEWVLDGYSAKGYELFKAGEVVKANQAYVQPEKKHKRVARGGSFQSMADECRSAARLHTTEDWSGGDPNHPKSPWWYTDDPSSGVGFRLIRPLDPPKTLEAKNKFWVTNQKALRDAKLRVEYQGRGGIAPVDEDFPNKINELEKK